MAYVTVFRHVPKPIVGVVSAVSDRRFAVLEESIDWLETTGMLVERFDPSTDLTEVAARPIVQQWLAKGDQCLPLVLVNDVVVLWSAYPSRTQLARAVGREQREGRQAGRPAA